MSDPYHGLFRWESGNGEPRIARPLVAPLTVPCPTTGRPLRIATIEAETSAICPSCESLGRGGFVSFEADLRMAYACPSCRQLVWVAGA